MGRQRRSKQPVGFRDQGADADVLSPALPAAPECKNLTDEFACPLAGAANFGEICRRLPTRPDRGIGHFRITKDCPDDVIEVVGYAAGESANGLHPAGLLQAQFPTLPLPFEKPAPNCPADRIAPPPQTGTPRAPIRG